MFIFGNLLHKRHISKKQHKLLSIFSVYHKPKMNLIVRMLLLLCCDLIYLTNLAVYTKISGLAVVPHGDFAYDPSLINYANGSLFVHIVAKKAGKYIDSLNPDIIVLMSPHSVALTRDFAIMQNSQGYGFAEIGQDLHNSSVEPYKVYGGINLAMKESENLLKYLDTQHLNISGITSFADTEPQAIRWGEIIPIAFLSKATLKRSKFILISHPTRRYDESRTMVPELLNLGNYLFDYFDSSREKIVFIGSSDLAHTHLASGPYGYPEAAEPFDRACGTWAIKPEENSNSLLTDAANLVDDALSCGFPSLVVLHGIIEKDFGRWNPRLYANEHPTYYGMMVSTF